MRLLPIALLAVFSATICVAQTAPASAVTVQHPALFLVGDSIMKTGKNDGATGPWGWGSELGAFFDPAKLHVYNEARGGRSSRSYIEEGAWAKVRAQLRPGDFVIVGFGHNDRENSAGHPNRTTITGDGDETVEIGVGPAKKIVRTYGAYLRQYVADIKAAGATPIVCSPVPRDQWDHGKIRRGFDGYAAWAAAAARESGAFFFDLNTLAADRFDALGEARTRALFFDWQHTRKAGAQLNAACVAAGLARLADCPLAKALQQPIP